MYIQGVISGWQEVKRRQNKGEQVCNFSLVIFVLVITPQAPEAAHGR